jgi:hypothetical protein
MEKENNEDKYALYDRYRHTALRYYELHEYEKAKKVLIMMVTNWPERVIARGRAISNPDVPESKLDRGPSIP